MKSKHLARLTTAIGAVLAGLVLLVPAAQAKEPAPGYTQFAGCPSPEEKAGLVGCFRSVISGGNFKMGSKNVPIVNPITLSGGYDEEGHVSASPKGGMPPVKQPVPGGIIGLTGLDWLVNFLNLEGLKLYAATELAGVPGPPFEEPLTLPIRVHLINSILGNNCYVGSFTSPIVLKLTTRTTSPPLPNKPISGVEPKASIDAKGIFHLDDGQFVDNSFAAPGASGCTLTLFGFFPIDLNPLVNLQSGLPSKAGTNETRQDFDAELTSPALVYP